MNKIRFKKDFSLFLGIAALHLASGGFTVAQAESLGFSVQTTHESGVVVEVLDDRTLTPLPDATVTVGSTSASARASTDRDGKAVFSGSPVRSVTVSRNDYASTTVLGIQGNRIQIFLKPLPFKDKEVLVTGQVNGWKPTPGNKPPVYMGLVFRTMSTFDLLHFDTTSIISPMKDTIDVWGPRQIPSNLVLPPQEIRILLGKVKVNKLNYRLPLIADQETRLLAAHAEMDSGDLMDFAGGGKFTPSSINKLRLNRIALSNALNPSSDLRQDFDGTVELVAGHQVTVSKPPFAGDVLVAALTDLAGDRKTLIPTDIRSALAPNSSGPIKPISVKTTATDIGAGRHLVTFAMTQDGHQLSGIITANAGKTASPGTFLNAEKLEDFQTVPATIPLAPTQQGISTAVFETKIQDGDREKKVPVWYVYSTPSAGSVQISTAKAPIPNSLKQITAYNIAHLEFGNSFNEGAIDGQNLMQSLSRFSHSRASIPTPKERKAIPDLFPWP